MKTRCLTVLVIFMLASSVLQADDRNFGFTGEMNEEATMEIPASFLPAFALDGDVDGKCSKVVPLAVGLKKNFRPVNPLSPNFLYYSYYLLVLDQWWAGFIVVNFDNKSHEIEVTIRVEGPTTSSTTKTIIIEGKKVKLYSAKINLAEFPALYHLTGKIEGKTVHTRSVRTRFYCYDVF